MSLKDLPADFLPREKLHALGPQSLSDGELLALLLRTGTPGRNVLQMANELLQPAPVGFGGLSGLLHTSPEELKRFKGLGGRAKRAELSAVLELARRALREGLSQRTVFGSPEQVKEYAQLQLGALPHECFAVLFLNAQHQLIQWETLFRGTLSQTSVYPREVVIRALHHGAAAVILAHNHPSGSVEPSPADQQLTHRLSAALSLVDVRVLDHVIVGPGASLSMAERGCL